MYLLEFVFTYDSRRKEASQHFEVERGHLRLGPGKTAIATALSIYTCRLARGTGNGSESAG